jgi:NAD+ synthase
MLKIDCEKTSQEIVRFIKSYINQAGFKKLIISLSGGLDSSTVTYLAVRALGKNNVLIVLLPHGDLHPESLDDAQLVIHKSRIPANNIIKIDIKKTVDQIASIDKNMDKIRKGNIMARVRMVYLFDSAKKYKALVCGAENKSEYLLGYFTRFGDQASDIDPIRHLYKTQVCQLAKYLRVPQKIINKKPTAGLWPNQTDEDELGFSYEEADKVLYLYFDKKLSEKEIVKYGIKVKTVEKVSSWVKKNEFKHNVPIALNNVRKSLPPSKKDLARNI